MARQLLRNTCFHEIKVDSIPLNTDITRIVSLNGNDATIHTRQANADTFNPKLPKGEEQRLFLITSYNKPVKGPKPNPIMIPGEGDVIPPPASDAASVAAPAAPGAAPAAPGADDAAPGAAPGADDDATDAATGPDDAATGPDDAATGPVTDMDGGKRTRRRKNHGSTRRNASNKRGRRASKKSRGRGKKQSKRHGRK